VGLKFNGAHQLLVHADDVNLLGDEKNTTKKNTEALIDASKEVDAEVNKEKTKYMLMSRHHNARQNYNVRIANRSFENVANVKEKVILLIYHRHTLLDPIFEYVGSSESNNTDCVIKSCRRLLLRFSTRLKFERCWTRCLLRPVLKQTSIIQTSPNYIFCVTLIVSNINDQNQSKYVLLASLCL
jgi:hypothetical protein